MVETEAGLIFQFFAKPNVAAVRITSGTLRIGDRIHVLGHSTDFTQTVDSIQFEHESLKEAKEGQEVGIKVLDRVRPHDKVYRIGD